MNKINPILSLLWSGGRMQSWQKIAMTAIVENDHSENDQEVGTEKST